MQKVLKCAHSFCTEAAAVRVLHRITVTSFCSRTEKQNISQQLAGRTHVDRPEGRVQEKDWIPHGSDGKLQLGLCDHVESCYFYESLEGLELVETFVSGRMLDGGFINLL